MFEAGLSFAVDLKKPDGFIGKEAVVAQKAAGPLTRRLVQVLLRDPAPMMHHAEIVRRDGVALGYIRAASYGHTLGGAVGLAMIESPGRKEPVNPAFLDSGRWEVEIANVLYPATLSLRPMYDPEMKKIKV